MNILLVDDDQYIMDAVKSMVDWEKVGIDNIYTANNIRQAQAIIEKSEIHLMLCDIEMPQGSGLELIEWERQHQNVIQVLFLTSHAQFEYACKAVQLRGLDYLLKPVAYDKLEVCLQKAVDKVKEEQKKHEYKRVYDQWEDSVENRKEIFWKNLFQNTASGGEELREQINDLLLEYKMDDSFRFMIVEIYDYRTIYEKLEYKMFSFIVKNITEEIFSTSGLKEECIVWMKSEDAARWNIILKEKNCSREQLQEICEKYIQMIERHMQSEVGCYVSNPTCLSGMGEVIGQMYRMYEDSVINEQKVFFLDAYRFREIQYMEPSFYAWECMLINSDREGLTESVASWLNELEESQEVNKQVLSFFRTDFTQMIYNVLHQRQIRVHRLFDGEKNEEAYKQSIRSVQCMEDYSLHLIDLTIKYMGMTRQTAMIIDQIKVYIEENMAEDITRNSFSEIACLNPEYLAKIFKKEEGISLGAYLMNRRMIRAKELLEKSKMSVSAVALETGYTNFSYFSKVFRKAAGYNPNEYRKLIRAKKEKT